MRYAEPADRKMYLCSMCNPKIAEQRRCAEPGFENLKRPIKMDKAANEYNFCPGKATWYLEFAELFEDCRVACETGILPKKGALDEQDALFVEVFATFVDRWKYRFYQQAWMDGASMAEAVLKAIASMFSGKPIK